MLLLILFLSSVNTKISFFRNCYLLESCSFTLSCCFRQSIMTSINCTIMYCVILKQLSCDTVTLWSFNNWVYLVFVLSFFCCSFSLSVTAFEKNKAIDTLVSFTSSAAWTSADFNLKRHASVRASFSEQECCESADRVWQLTADASHTAVVATMFIFSRHHTLQAVSWSVVYSLLCAVYRLLHVFSTIRRLSVCWRGVHERCGRLAQHGNNYSCSS